ncbi:MAG TPA: DUF6529 family protein [Amycolatopsis sp.]|uniref:DUF6529 family protein n=1 Tax=Amycolatopsis sp. TaxID=37632 RepID=UPI002B472E14|nr:DUF6529 family protein [Amycolatopsis sp.]HKS49222.1 DUF6529 family protein [Amycolatopsis sp.]
MIDPPTTPIPRAGRATRFGPVMVALAAGAAVSVALGLYAGLHEPTGVAVNLAGFSSFMAVKTWLTTVAVVLAIGQLLSALALFGKLPGVSGGRGVAALHRWSGRLAVAVTVPVAAHCLFALGFQTFDTRILLHSLLGCFFYGVFVCKMLVLTREDSPGWVLPTVGGAVFAAMVALWFSSAYWFFTTFGVTF